jgi:hypothetical protein
MQQAHDSTSQFTSPDKSASGHALSIKNWWHVYEIPTGSKTRHDHACTLAGTTLKQQRPLHQHAICSSSRRTVAAADCLKVIPTAVMTRRKP